MWCRRAWRFGLLLLCSLVCFSASAFASDAVVWSPNQSSAGGSQYDPRLDKPVKMWRTGAALSEVFAQIEKQTGVKVACEPADPDTPRIPVNVFLNEIKPPSLREFLVQLSWVLDDNFCVRGESGQQVYEPMNLGGGEGAQKRLDQKAAEERKAQYAARGLGAREAGGTAARPLALAGRGRRSVSRNGRRAAPHPARPRAPRGGRVRTAVPADVGRPT